MTLKLSDPALHVGIVTENGERMLDFYNRVFGLESVGEIPFPGLGVVHKLQCGNSQIKLLVLESPAQSHNPGGGFSSATGYRYLSFNIANIDAVVEACDKDCCQIVVAVKELRPGVKAAMVQDPDGNTIEFMQMD
ncbi:VOC family protein [Dasania marina]|uniref:VOC family protein n=1 Tax=Dasania marina TaxID=471499 RepID=UPI00037EC6FC|nr:VOC family protein [Dasania marina]